MMNEEQIIRMKKLHKDIIRGIEKRSSSTQRDLRDLNIEEIEKKINMKIVNPKKTPIIFEWELQEKLANEGRSCQEF